MSRVWTQEALDRIKTEARERYAELVVDNDMPVWGGACRWPEDAEWAAARWAARPPETPAERFARLDADWYHEAGVYSDSARFFATEGYKGIVAMGEEAIPFLVAEMRAGPNHYMRALSLITGDNPVPSDANGDWGVILGAWRDWADAHGY